MAVTSLSQPTRSGGACGSEPEETLLLAILVLWVAPISPHPGQETLILGIPGVLTLCLSLPLPPCPNSLLYPLGCPGPGGGRRAVLGLGGWPVSQRCCSTTWMHDFHQRPETQLSGVIGAGGGVQWKNEDVRAAFVQPSGVAPLPPQCSLCSKLLSWESRLCSW